MYESPVARNRGSSGLSGRAFRVSAVALLAMLVVFSSGCSPSGPVGAINPPKSPVGASAAGAYASGDHVALADGMSLTVPAGWTLRLRTRGALVTASEDASEVIAASLEQTGTARWGSFMMSVYGPGSSAFEDQRLISEAGYSNRGSAEALVRYTRTRTVLHPDADTTATAFVTDYKGDTPRRGIVILVESRGVDPFMFWGETYKLPAEWARASDEDLPRLVLDHFAFEPR
jgi:hypothetical protein